MVYQMQGNIQAKKMLEVVRSQIVERGEVRFPFVLIQDAGGIGVWEWIQDALQSLVEAYAQDLKIFRDLSQELGKRHIFKVDVPPRDQQISLAGGEIVHNRGARQVTNWLSLAPAGSIKIVLIEQIERMNVQAMNALLKSLEEPLPGRMIVATTKNIDGLLDTIVSRALLIRTIGRQTGDEMLERFWCGQDGEKGLETSHKSQDARHKQQEMYAELEGLIFAGERGYRVVQLTKELTTRVSDEQLLELLTLRASDAGHHSLIDRLTLAKKMIRANVKGEHVWFGLGVREDREIGE